MNQHALKTGVIIAVISMIISLVIYILDPTFFAAWWFQLVLLFVTLGFICYQGIQYRNGEGGYMDFGKAWIYSLTAMLTSGLISTLFSILLFTVVDPELAEIVADAAAETAESMARSFGAPEGAIDDAVEKAKADTLDRLTPKGYAVSFLWSILVSGIISLITGLIIRKKKPVEFG